MPLLGTCLHWISFVWQNSRMSLGTALTVSGGMGKKIPLRLGFISLSSPLDVSESDVQVFVNK